MQTEHRTSLVMALPFPPDPYRGTHSRRRFLIQNARWREHSGRTNPRPDPPVSTIVFKTRYRPSYFKVAFSAAPGLCRSLWFRALEDGRLPPKMFGEELRILFLGGEM